MNALLVEMDGFEGAAGVIVMNTPFGNSITTAEHAIALMLALVKQLPAWPATHLQGGGWRTPQVW